MRLGLDVYGGDFAPVATIEGLGLLLTELPEGDCVVLFGDEQSILSQVDHNLIKSGRIEIVHAPEVIEMADSPTRAFQSKPNSSIVKGFDRLKSGDIDAFASAGNSGAMMVGSVHMINTIPGVIRPSSAVLIPKVNGGNTVILDVGTNPDAKSDVMYQYGLLGSCYAEDVFGINNPKVGLLNIGEEEKKGNLLVQSAFLLMKDSPDFNFIGNVEGRDLFGEKADVVVCDGFTGNVVIKQIQAMYRLMEKRGLLDDYFKSFNYELYGGSPIIGINKTVVIGHGISSALAIKNMMLLSRSIASSSFIEKLTVAISNCSQ
ncbi:MAG: phosphate acyltransferase [Bacteroidales bacterium]|nr:phosphate acyltransferase [Bacteroidales bacterium]